MPISDDEAYKQGKRIAQDMMRGAYDPSKDYSEKKAEHDTRSAKPERPPPQPARELSSSEEEQLLPLLRADRFVEAIKRYREIVPGCGLADARSAVAAIAQKRGIQVKQSSCFVATAVFGGADVFEVRVLRDWRDTCLSSTTEGKALIIVYEQIGPRLATAVSCSPMLRRMFRAALTRFARHLSERFT